MEIAFRQLPDINSLTDLERHGLAQYGRFGICQDGSLWFGDHHTSHPRELQVGWYWAVDVYRNLVLSSRNVVSDIDTLKRDKQIINTLLHELVRMRIITRKQIMELK